MNYMDALTYGAQEEAYFERQADFVGYTRISTFYSDISIAEWFEINDVEKGAIRDTFDTVMENWIGDFRMITEFILSLNWKSWEWAEKNPELAEQYVNLYYEAQDKFYEYYADNEEAKHYFFMVTD